MKFIIGVLTTISVGCVGCGGLVNTDAFAIRAAAITFPPPGDNHAAERERNLNVAMQRAVEDQEILDRVDYMYGFEL